MNISLKCASEKPPPGGQVHLLYHNNNLQLFGQFHGGQTSSPKQPGYETGVKLFPHNEYKTE